MENINNITSVKPSAAIIERMDYLISRLNGIKSADFSDEENAFADEQENLWNSYNFRDYKFEENGCVGLKNCKGEIRIPAKYADICECRELGIYGYENVIPVVNSQGKKGFVNIKGEEVCPCKYDDAEVFDFENYIVTINNKVGLVDVNGKEVTECIYEQICEPFGLVKILVMDQGLYGLYSSKNGGITVPCIFGAVEEMNGCIYVSASGTWGYVDTYGNFIPETDKERITNSQLIKFGPNLSLLP